MYALPPASTAIPRPTSSHLSPTLVAHSSAPAGLNFATNASTSCRVADGLVPTMYVFPPASTATRVAESSPSPPKYVEYPRTESLATIGGVRANGATDEKMSAPHTRATNRLLIVMSTSIRTALRDCE